MFQSKVGWIWAGAMLGSGFIRSARGGSGVPPWPERLWRANGCQVSYIMGRAHRTCPRARPPARKLQVGNADYGVSLEDEDENDDENDSDTEH